MHGYFVTFVPQHLSLMVIVVLVTDEKGASQRAPVRIFSAARLKYSGVDVPVVVVDCVIKG